MAHKRLLYFTAGRVTLYRWALGHLAQEARFANNEEGAIAFAAHLHGVPSSLFYILVDIVEEDFYQENVPFVRGADRRALLARKLAQRYRDTSLALSLSLGYERTQRRDERVLFSSFTNNAQFQPWLAALQDEEATVAGVYSAALLAPRLAKTLGAKKAPSLIVTLQEAGLRQTYIEGGKLRFSRLGLLEGDDASDPNRIADAFDRETTRVHQYLTATRILAREGAPIDAVLVAPPGEKRRIEGAAPNLPQVRATVLDLHDAAKLIGLKAYPQGSGAEVLFLHLVAKHPPGRQYGGEELRQFYRLHQTRVGLVAGGLAVCVIALVYAGVQLARAYMLDDQIHVDQDRTDAAMAAYGKVTSSFPRLPTTPENLRATMEKYSQLTKRSSSPDRLAVEISRALDASAKIDIDRIRWEIGANPRERIKEGDSGRGATTGAATGKIAAGPLYEIAEVSGHVSAIRASDHRNITRAVNEFLDALRARPGVEIVQARMPFEFGSQTRLSGDIGGEAAAEVPRFVVTVARRLGT